LSQRLKRSKDDSKEDFDISDLPRSYFGPWILDLNNNNYSKFEGKINTWVIIIFNEKSDFDFKTIKELNAFAYKFGDYVTVMKLQCKKQGNKKLCDKFKFKSILPKVYLYNIDVEKPVIFKEDGFSSKSLENKILKNFEDYNYVIKKSKDPYTVSEEIAAYWNSSESRPIITLFIHKKDHILLHTLISVYRNEINFILGHFDEALRHKLDQWNSAVFDWDEEVLTFNGILDFKKMNKWIEGLKKSYTEQIPEFNSKNITEEIHRKNSYLFKITKKMVDKPFILKKFANSIIDNFLVFRVDTDMIDSFFFIDNPK